jgi:hypothetical protein
MLHWFICYRHQRAEYRGHKVAKSFHIRTFLEDTLPQTVTGPSIQLFSCRSHLRNSHDSHTVAFDEINEKYECAVTFSDMMFIPSHENPSIVPRLLGDASRGQSPFCLMKWPQQAEPCRSSTPCLVPTSPQAAVPTNPSLPHKQISVCRSGRSLPNVR